MDAKKVLFYIVKANPELTPFGFQYLIEGQPHWSAQKLKDLRARWPNFEAEFYRYTVLMRKGKQQLSANEQHGAAIAAAIHLGMPFIRRADSPGVDMTDHVERAAAVILRGVPEPERQTVIAMARGLVAEFDAEMSAEEKASAKLRRRTSGRR